jgi:hypothetical protein
MKTSPGLVLSVAPCLACSHRHLHPHSHFHHPLSLSLSALSPPFHPLGSPIVHAVHSSHCVPPPIAPLLSSDFSDAMLRPGESCCLITPCSSYRPVITLLTMDDSGTWLAMKIVSLHPRSCFVSCFRQTDSFALQGTWPFMSTRLLTTYEFKIHELRDDLESLWFVLLYEALHFVRHNSLFGIHMGDIFNQV